MESFAARHLLLLGVEQCTVLAALTLATATCHGTSNICYEYNITEGFDPESFDKREPTILQYCVMMTNTKQHVLTRTRAGALSWTHGSTAQVKMALGTVERGGTGTLDGDCAVGVGKVNKDEEELLSSLPRGDQLENKNAEREADTDHAGLKNLGPTATFRSVSIADEMVGVRDLILCFRCFLSPGVCVFVLALRMRVGGITNRGYTFMDHYLSTAALL